MGRLELSDFIQLIRAKVDILKLKADSYEWQCTIPADVKAELEKTLKEIDSALAIGHHGPDGTSGKSLRRRANERHRWVLGK